MNRHGFQLMAFAVLVFAVASGGRWGTALGDPPEDKGKGKNKPKGDVGSDVS